MLSLDAPSSNAPRLTHRGFFGKGKAATVSTDILDFGAERRKRAQPAAIPRVRRQRRDLVMDVLQDRRGPPIFFSIVQPHGSPEILMLGQFTSQSAAVHAGEQFMSDYLFRRQANAA